MNEIKSIIPHLKFCNYFQNFTGTITNIVGVFFLFLYLFFGTILLQQFVEPSQGYACYKRILANYIFIQITSQIKC